MALGFIVVLATSSAPFFADTAKADTTKANAGDTPTAVSPAAGPSEGTEPAPPKRAKISCAQYRENAEKATKHAIIDTRLKAGSWGRVPPELRKLPRRSKLCGADGRGQVVIVSPLFGKELEAHYSPLLAKIGFGPLACKVEGGHTQCTCKRGRDITIVITDQEDEAFVLAVLTRQGKPK